VDSTTLIWIVVGIIVVLVIVGVIIALMTTARGRRERRMEHQHNRAEEMRNQARETALQAKQHEAEAARAHADAVAAKAEAEQAKARAAQAQVDAERRAGTIGEHQSEAQSLRAQEAEQRRKADDVDPYVNADGTRTTPDGRRADDPRIDDGTGVDGTRVDDPRVDDGHRDTATRGTRAGQDARTVQQTQNERASVSNNPPPDRRSS
jgi:hypothetical protein